MVARNDITGDAIRSRDSQAFADRFDAVQWKAEQETKSEFLIYYCNRCHIKVATNNGHCPCCDEAEWLEDVK